MWKGIKMQGEENVKANMATLMRTQCKHMKVKHEERPP